MPTTSITTGNGRDFQIKAADPDVSPSVYASIGGLQSTSMTINNNPVDITSVTSLGFREWDADAGIQDVSITASGIFDSATTGAQSLETSARTRVLVEVQIDSGHGDSFNFAAVVNSFERSGEQDGVELFNTSITSHGTIHYQAA